MWGARLVVVYMCACASVRVCRREGCVQHARHRGAAARMQGAAAAWALGVLGWTADSTAPYLATRCPKVRLPRAVPLS